MVVGSGGNTRKKTGHRILREIKKRVTSKNVLMEAHFDPKADVDGRCVCMYDTRVKMGVYC